MNPKWQKLYALAQLHEEFWTRSAQHQSDRYWRDVYKSFFSLWWDTWYRRVLAYGPTWDAPATAIQEAAEGLSGIREKAAEIGLPIPDLGTSRQGFIRPEERTQVSGGSNTIDIIGMERFTQACEADYQGGIFTLSCQAQRNDGNVYNYRRSVDLRPAINYIHQKMVDWHRAQHGDTNVSGWTDFVKDAYHSAENAAKSVAHSKLGKELWKQVKAHTDDIEDAAASFVPGGSQALALARKASKLYDDAKKNHPEAVAKVKQLVGLADSGNTKAQYAVKVMQATKLITQAKEAGVPPQQVLPAPQKQSTSLYDMGLTGVSGVAVGWMPGSAAMLAQAKRNAQKARGRDHRAPAHRKGGYGGVVQSNPTHRSFRPTDMFAQAQAQQQGTLPPPPDQQAAAPSGGGGGGGGDDQGYDPGYDDQGYDPGYDASQEQQYDASQEQYTCDPAYDPDCDPNVSGNYDLDVADDYEADMEVYDRRGRRVEVSGWMYNRPYRRTADAMTQLQKSPGVGFAVRELYNRGLGRGNTSLSDVAASVIDQL